MILRNRFTKALQRRLAPRLFRVASSRPPDFIIGADHPEGAYLERWYVIPRNPLFNVYLHRFLRDDEDRALHDHPWASVSLSLSGVLAEVFRARRGGEEKRVIVPGSLVIRGARFAHRLILRDDLAGTYGGCWTLFLTGPRVRAWGFLCPQGWVHWRRFTAPSDRGRGGRGCA